VRFTPLLFPLLQRERRRVDRAPQARRFADEDPLWTDAAMPDHVNAAEAALTAASTSACVDMDTRAITSPVHGETTSWVLLDETNAPLRKFLHSRTVLGRSTNIVGYLADGRCSPAFARNY
jgi:hypothetical protein